MKSFRVFTLSFLLMAAPQGRAAEGFWREAWQDFKSPVSTTPARWVLLGGGLATALVIAFPDRLEHPFQSYMARERPLGAWRRVGNLGGEGYLNLAYVGGMYLSSLWGDDETSRNRSVLMLKSTLYTSLVTVTLKSTAREPRPANSSELTSWPSGHSSMAFSFASVIGAEHEWYWGAAAYTLATLTGLSRLNDNRHFVRDVLAGATIGASYGLGLYTRQKNRGALGRLRSGEGAQYVTTLLPWGDLSGATWTLSAQF